MTSRSRAGSPAKHDERQGSLFDDAAPAASTDNATVPEQAAPQATGTPEVPKAADAQPRRRGRPPKSGASSTPVSGPVAAAATPGSGGDNAAGPLKGLVEDQFDALPHDWKTLVSPFVESAAYAPLCRFVDAEVATGKTVYPADIFHALRMTSPKDVKVVILGQDPYHGDDHGIAQAHGLAFSVQRGVRVPPSLRNIYKEIERDLGIPAPSHGNLDAWAKQGVLLLNTTLTVEAANAASHAKPFKTGGWQACTDTLLSGLAAQQGPLVFLLWGSHAQAKAPLLAGHGHLLLEAPHPSPLSAHRGFLGCGHFSAANAFLRQHGKTPIDWRVPN
ncbi:uracil-DNA glycosylase [Pandoraea apista]|uniref:Uracil-DNA glycosylase n=1 Tax=Pandoraea apista TaxID=93218 RepID=A0A5E5P8C8_9BURK|nr:uracil-DNA glycosylase [Pandoraea apista]OXS97121.1 uracil-DNA glycosylase [Pandoraea apista]VVG72918.1 uracil-DNA glycosylase [Pandoraea apista]